MDEESPNTELPEKRAAFVKAMSYISDKEVADNFRDPERAAALKAAGKNTTIAEFNLPEGMSRPEFQKLLDGCAEAAQEELRLATQKLVLAELGDEQAAGAIREHTLNLKVRERMDEVLAETAQRIGHDKPSLGKGVV